VSFDGSRRHREGWVQPVARADNNLHARSARHVLEKANVAADVRRRHIDDGVDARAFELRERGDDTVSECRSTSDERRPRLENPC
jgi:hypothetical protein